MVETVLYCIVGIAPARFFHLLRDFGNHGFVRLNDVHHAKQESLVRIGIPASFSAHDGGGGLDVNGDVIDIKSF